MKLTNRKILITGACGYVGSQLLQSINSLGSDLTVRILDNFTSGSKAALLNLPKGVRYELIEGDILNTAILDLAMTGVDTVIHLAALVKTPMSFGDSNRLEQINHWGTQNLLEAALNKKVKQFIYTGSTAVYGPAMDGKDPTEFRPFGHYANSIFNAEKSVFAYMKRGLPATILRLGTVYGNAPVTRFVSVVNRLVHMAATKKTLTVFGKGNQVRPFIHVNDVANSIFYAMNNWEIVENKAFNVIEENYTINEIATFISKTDESIKIYYTDQDIRNHFSFLIKHDLLRENGWEPQHFLGTAISDQLANYVGFHKITP